MPYHSDRREVSLSRGRRVPAGRHAAHRTRVPAGRRQARRGGRHRADGRARAAVRPRAVVPGSSRRASRRGSFALVRLPAIALLGGVALSLMIFQYQFRELEARATADVYRLFTPVLAATRAPIIWFGLGRSGAFGLEITPDCSAALLIVPLCGLGMLLMIPRRLAVGRVGAALAAAALVMVIGNLLRIGVIAVAVRLDGVGTGYQIGHLILGSIVSIIGIALALILLVAIVTSRRGMEASIAMRPRHRRAH